MKEHTEAFLNHFNNCTINQRKDENNFLDWSGIDTLKDLAENGKLKKEHGVLFKLCNICDFKDNFNSKYLSYKIKGETELNIASLFASKDLCRPSINNILCSYEDQSVISTNGHIMCKLPYFMECPTHTITAHESDNCKKHSQIEEDGNPVPFPNWKYIFPSKDPSISFSIDPIETIKKINLLLNLESAFYYSIGVTKKRFMSCSKNIQKAICKYCFGAETVLFDMEYLKLVLNSIVSLYRKNMNCHISIYGTCSPILLSCEKSDFLIMPIQYNNEDLSNNFVLDLTGESI